MSSSPEPKERPILFSAPMVRAILGGRKTVTRRPVKGAGLKWLEEFTPEYVAEPANGLCPYGQLGERLWVREACRYPASLDHYSPSAIGEKALDAGYTKPWCPTHFEADGARNDGWQGFETPPAVSVPGKLRPPMFMPRWASRILLEITAVRVERLQDISDAQIEAEGIDLDALTDGQDRYDMCHAGSGAEGRPTLQTAWRDLWQSINGLESWTANPWVWVVEFKQATP